MLRQPGPHRLGAPLRAAGVEPEDGCEYEVSPAQAELQTALVEMLRAVDLRLVASGHVHQRRDFTFGHIRHVWAPSVGFIIPDKMQDVIGIKEVGLVEYRFQPDSFEVRQVRAPGQVDIGVDSLIGTANKEALK